MSTYNCTVYHSFNFNFIAYLKSKRHNISYKNITVFFYLKKCACDEFRKSVHVKVLVQVLAVKCSFFIKDNSSSIYLLSLHLKAWHLKCNKCS